jgi:hypothetical protein
VTAFAAKSLALDRFTVHIQWGPRASTVEGTGRSLAGLLRLIADADPRITMWFPGDDDRFGFTTADLAEYPEPLIRLAQDVADGDPPTVRLEMQTADVDGAGTPASALDITIGSVDRYEPNHFTWNLMEAGPQVLASPAAAISLLRALVALTDCDWGAISSSDIDSWQPARPDGPTLGWATYLAHRLLPTGPPVISGTAAEPVHRGYLLTLADRPEHTVQDVVAAAATVLESKAASSSA